MNRFGPIFKQTVDRSSRLILGGCILLIASACGVAQEPPADVRAAQRWAVILVGLPGDAEHAAPFRRTADAIEEWLRESQQIPPAQILRLPSEAAAGEPSNTSVTAEAMHSLFDDLNGKLRPEDALWVFTIGHGNTDGQHAWFHVAGKDPSGEDFAQWLADVPCREQVFWLTHSTSGWFVKPLSRPGRIVIAATAADDESNETEFPQALATVVKSSAQSLDSDQDQAVSVAELFNAVVAEVSRRFKKDDRLPTEHAQLDDNGDGVGTEAINQAKPDETSDEKPEDRGTTKLPSPQVDGDLAKKIFIPFPEVQRVVTEPLPPE